MISAFDDLPCLGATLNSDVIAVFDKYHQHFLRDIIVDKKTIRENETTSHVLGGVGMCG